MSSLASGDKELWKRSEVRMESSEKVWVSLEEKVTEWVWSEGSPAPPRLLQDGDSNETSCCTNLQNWRGEK